MGEALVQQAEASIREGVRNVESSRLRGEVSVVHWSAIKGALEGSLNQLHGNISRLTQERDAAVQELRQLRDGSAESSAQRAGLEAQLQQVMAEKAAHEAALAAMRKDTGEDLAAKVMRLERELIDLRKRLLEYEEACDVMALVVDFDLTKFETFARDLANAANGMGTPSAKAAAAPLNSLLLKARETKAVLDELVTMMNENRASVREVVRMVNLGRDLEAFQARADCIQGKLALLAM